MMSVEIRMGKILLDRRTTARSQVGTDPWTAF
jgi:hypothetical protein